MICRNHWINQAWQTLKLKVYCSLQFFFYVHKMFDYKKNFTYRIFYFQCCLFSWLRLNVF